MNGYIKLYRSITDHWLWENKPFSKGQAWIDLLMFVYRFDSKEPIDGQIQVTKAGSRWTGYRELGERWGWGRHKVHDFLKLLESDKMVELKSNTKGTLVTIVNYGNFQLAGDTEGTQKGHKRDTEGTRRGTDKKERIIRKIRIII